jgi:hypothetical protein
MNLAVRASSLCSTAAYCVSGVMNPRCQAPPLPEPSASYDTDVARHFPGSPSGASTG